MDEKILLRGNELARQFGVTSSTIKYYTILGLLEVSETTNGGMKLYDYYPTKHRISEIRGFRKRGMSIKEIQRHYGIIE